MNKLFVLREDLPRVTNLILTFFGFVVLILLWGVIAKILSSPLLPSPLKVLLSLKELHFEDALVRNLLISVKLNLLGYLEAVLISLPIGFVIGLFPLTKSLFSKPIDALRFVPLTAATGLFVMWFGIENSMKINFLAFGIIVYLVPVIVQRITEVEQVYQHTAITLGASQWQMIITVFIPAVLSKVSDDVRVLVAISWTYIIVAELVNQKGGIGALAYMSARFGGRIDKVFAILIIIILVGFIQDKLFRLADRCLFKYKYM
jgi:NitT/TauT family transport system permease protein